jgi:uncharacterized protein (DUF2141 family)
MRSLFAAFLIATGTACMGQATLTVVIEHSRPPLPGTQVKVVIATTQECFVQDHGCRVVKGETATTVTRVTIDSLAPGRYGLLVYIDENDNGKLDKGWNNTFTEPHVFGNDATKTTGYPAFENTGIEVRDGMNVHRMRMH